MNDVEYQIVHQSRVYKVPSRGTVASCPGCGMPMDDKPPQWKSWLPVERQISLDAAMTPASSVRIIELPCEDMRVLFHGLVQHFVKPTNYEQRLLKRKT